MYTQPDTHTHICSLARSHTKPYARYCPVRLRCWRIYVYVEEYAYFYRSRKHIFSQHTHGRVHLHSQTHIIHSAIDTHIAWQAGADHTVKRSPAPAPAVDPVRGIKICVLTPFFGAERLWVRRRRHTRTHTHTYHIANILLSQEREIFKAREQHPSQRR